jgi:hypothetical protein
VSRELMPKAAVSQPRRIICRSSSGCYEARLPQPSGLLPARGFRAGWADKDSFRHQIGVMSRDECHRIRAIDLIKETEHKQKCLATE